MMPFCRLSNLQPPHVDFVNKNELNKEGQISKVCAAVASTGISIALPEINKMELKQFFKKLIEFSDTT